MSTTVEFYEYAVECFSRVGNVRLRKMMGEYCVYYKERLVGDICDNCLFLKVTPSSDRLFPECERGYPYEGSKTLMIMTDALDDPELLRRAFDEMLGELPEKKKK